MQLEKLEKLKERHKGLRNELNSLVVYLRELESKRIRKVVPGIVSKRLEIPYGEAVYLLGLGERDSVLRKGYEVYTADSNHFLGEFENTNDIPRTIYNPATGSEVPYSDFVVDLVYYFT